MTDTTHSNPFSADSQLKRTMAQVDAAIARQQAAEAERQQITADDGVLLFNVAQLAPKPVRWLWPGWLAQGKLHVLAGAPGEGKTTIAMSFAATISAGNQWPDGTWAEPGNVLIWSGEDDPEDTLVPRLIAAGAEPSRCYIVGGRRVDGELRSFDPARDMAALHEQASRIGDVRLLIVDPLVSAVAGDGHKNNEVRRALQPMVDLGQRLGAAVLGISHLSKGGGADGNPLNRVNGSIAFGALARLVLLTGTARKPTGLNAEAQASGLAGSGGSDTWRLLTRAKSNIGPDGGGFAYQVEQVMPRPGITTNGIVWGEQLAGSARELLADTSGDRAGNDAPSQTALDEAAEFLRDALVAGPMRSNAVKAEAAEVGLSWVTVRRASDNMGVIKTRHSGGYWEWALARLPREM